MRRWVALRAISTEEGADTLIFLASSPEVERVSGQYFFKRKPAQAEVPAPARGSLPGVPPSKMNSGDPDSRLRAGQSRMLGRPPSELPSTAVGAVGVPRF